MLDPILRPLIDKPLDRIGARLARAGVPADTVTLAGFVVGLGAMAAMAGQSYWTALALIGLNRLLDGLDGAVARQGAGSSDFGGYLDIVLDFIVYSGVVFAFALGRPDHGVAAAFLVFSFVGTGSSFLAYAIMAAKRGITSGMHGHKSLYFLGGLTEGTETALVMAAICLAPGWFDWIAVGFGAACWLTTLGRILAARAAFRR
ncbi:MAG: CDP-alcohol phosphatidyltransferase family protein [Rhodospirillaceae bacterium]|nr:CDP-alcohol phosphatidyltransferase family protein [Rhodospirillaceae bacterium]